MGPYVDNQPVWLVNELKQFKVRVRKIVVQQLTFVCANMSVGGSGFHPVYGSYCKAA